MVVLINRHDTTRHDMPQDENLHIVYVVNFQQAKVTFLYLTSLLQVKIFMEIALERRMFLTGKI